MEAFENLFDGLLVLRPYVKYFVLQDHALMVYLTDETVVPERVLLVLRMAGWSYMESGCWIYD